MTVRLPGWLLLLGLFLGVVLGSTAWAVPRRPATLLAPSGVAVPIEKALGTGHKVVLVTKPWVEANEQLFADLVHYKIRLNRGGLRSAVVFLRSDPAEARKSIGSSEGALRYFFDQDGELAAALGVRTLPAIVLVDPRWRVVFSAPVLSREMVRQIAQHYAKPDDLLPRPAVTRSPRPGLPDANGGIGRYSIR